MKAEFSVPTLLKGEASLLIGTVSASEMEPRRTQNYPSRSKSATLVFVWDELNEPFNPVKEMVTGARYNKPYDWYRTWVPLVLEGLHIGYDQAFHSLEWSQRCGCTCPCSPGFRVVDDRIDLPIVIQGLGMIHITMKSTRLLVTVSE